MATPVVARASANLVVAGGQLSRLGRNEPQAYTTTREPLSKTDKPKSRFFRHGK
jgi:hypothetical protein